MNQSEIPAVPMPTILIVDDSLSYLSALLDRLAVLQAPEIKVSARIAEFARPDRLQALPDDGARPPTAAKYAPSPVGMPAWERLN